MNKTIFIPTVILFTIVTFSLPSNAGNLSELYRPDMIDVEDNRLFVMEGTSIHIFDLKDLKLLVKFGKKGEGPGELKKVLVFPNYLKVLPDSILVNSFDKMIIFSKDGKLITERKKNALLSQMTPVGKNFAAKGGKIENKTRYVTINLYNPEMKMIKELYAQPFALQGNNDILHLMMDFLNFQVDEDKIFIEESPGGFIIEVFDSEGRHLDKIVKECEKLKITKHDQDNILESLSYDPSIRASGGWETVKKLVKFKFADFFPAIQDIKVNNKKIYIKTFKMINNKEEYVIMDLKGKILKTVYLQKVKSSPFYHNVLGAKLYTINNNKIYYLEENEEEETWELQVEEINL